MEVFSFSEDFTKKVGKILARFLDRGTVLALFGELGCGKTTFVKGVAEGLEKDEEFIVTSPTFTILNIYPAKIPIYHIDLYRISGVDEFFSLGLFEYLFGDGVCVIEWAEKIRDIIAFGILLEFEFVEDKRVMKFSTKGDKFEDILKRFERELKNLLVGV